MSPVRDMTKIFRQDGSRRVCANSYAQAVTQLVESALMIEHDTPLTLSVQ